MAEQQETLLERLIPGDLEHQIPAALENALPGGFRNRMVQAALGLLITFGFAFVVRRMLEKREAKQRALAAARTPAPLGDARPAELPPPPPVAQAMADFAETRLPPPPPRSDQGALRSKLAAPHIRLSGPIDQAMYQIFREQLAAAPGEGTLVVAMSSLGGDPEIARLMGDDLRLMRDPGGRDMLFIGQVAVYSAAATFMASFPADKRFLTQGTRLLLHERLIDRNVRLSGSLGSCLAGLRAAVHEIEESIRIEEEGFRALVAGTRLSFDEIRRRAADSWYVEAEQARELGLVRDVI